LTQDVRTRILIADCHPFVRTHYKRVLETQSDFVVVGVAEDGQDAIKKASELAPDVVLIDAFLPKLDGMRATHQILEQRPKTAIVMISSYDHPRLVKELIKRDPERKAFLLKDSLADIGDLVRAVASVANGQLVLDLNIVRKLGRQYVNRSLLYRLTNVERQVVMLMISGVQNSAIAESLGIDPALSGWIY